MQIAIKYVNPPREGKKFGSIKTPDGQTFWVPGNLINEFQPNTTVEVPIQDAKWGTSVVKVVSGSPQAASTTQAAWQPPRPNPPAVAASASGNMDRKDALIFITGVVGRAMGSGQFKAADIETLTHEATKTWFALKDEIG